MIVCPRCEHHNREDATACVSCGASLEHAPFRACPACKALNARTAMYCHRCFAPLDPRVQAALDSAPPVRPASAHRESPARSPLQPYRVPAATPSAAGTRPPSGPPVPAQDSDGSPTPPPEFAGAADHASAQADPLASVHDALPFDPALLDWRGTVPGDASPTPAELRAAELFRRIATERAPLSEGRVQVVPDRPRSLGKKGRMLLSLLVLVAALVPQFSGGRTSALVSPRPSVQALAAQLRALTPGQPAVVSFDYTGASAGEMTPAAVALLGALVERGVPFLLMSGNPAGVGLAQRAVALLEADRGQPLVYGTDYLLLGYLSGDEAGIRSLVTRMGEAFPVDASEGLPLTEYAVVAADEGLGGARNVFVLADDQSAIRRWVEQAAARSDARYHAMVTARIEPLVAPYQRTGQLATLVSGLAGSVELPLAIAPQSTPPPLSDGLAALTALVGGVALATNLAPLIGRRKEP